MNRSKKNAIMNQKEYLDSKSILKSYPRVVFVELTQNCNLACKMCDRAKKYGNIHNRKLNMTMELYKKIEKQLFPFVKIIDLHGNGETTQHPDFLSFLDIAKKYNTRVRMVTNLNIPNEKTVEKIIKNDILLAISIDSPVPKDYMEIRKGSSFDLLTNNLNLIKKYRKKYKTCIDLRILMTIDRKNIKDLNKMIDFIKSFDIRKISVWRRYLDQGDTNDIILDIDSVTKKLLASMNYATKHDIELRVISWPKKFTNKYKFPKKCIKPWSCIHINYDGSIGICDFNETPEGLSKYSLANNNFDEIWNNDFYVKLRESFCKGTPSEKFCAEVCKNENYIDFEENFEKSKEKFIMNNYTLQQYE